MPVENETETQVKSESKGVKYSTPMAITAAGAIIALAIVFTHYAPAGGTNTAGGQQAAAAEAIKVNIKDIDTSDTPFIGDENAPVVIAAWEDFQCPFCKRFEETTLPDIQKNYIDNGKVKIVFKDFNFLGEDSQIAGIYGRAVWELYPAKYFEWREAMFKAQDDEGDQGFGDEASIKKLLGTISGIDAAKVSKAATDNKDKYKSAIDADKAEASKYGINGTPGFIIGKQSISGARPFTDFQAAIDTLLK